MTPDCVRWSTHRGVARLLRAGAPCVLVALALAFAGCTPGPHDDQPSPPGPRLADDIVERAADLVPVVLDIDASHLSRQDVELLDRLVEAAAPVDDVFLLQADARNPHLRSLLTALGHPDGDVALEYFDAQYGIYERHRAGRGFLDSVGARRPGAGFYPDDLTVDEWKNYLESHPDREAELISLTTVVERRDGGLAGVPYSRAYAEQLEPCGEALLEAARATSHTAVAHHLQLLSQALRDDAYRPAEAAWAILDAPVELILGPHETSEDRLFGFKAAFEALVIVGKPPATGRARETARRIAEALGTLESRVPGAEPRSVPAIHVVDLAYAAGRARTPPLTMAVSLPVDLEIQRQLGAKILVFDNVLETKAEELLRPLASAGLPAPLAAEVNARDLLDLALAHQVAHHVTGLPLAERAERLLETTRLIEGLRADLLALEVLLAAGADDARALSLTATRLADLLRRARFPGTPEADGAWLQWNLLIEAGLTPEWLALAPSAREIVARLRTLREDVSAIEARGDYESARTLIDTHRRLSPDLERRLAALESLPYALRPVFAAAGERID